MSRNTKPRKPYKPKPVAHWFGRDARNDIEIMAHYFAPKLAAGLFDTVDGNTLAYLLNLCRRIAVMSHYQSMVVTTDVCMEAFLSIRQRHDRTGKWGASGEELTILEEALPHIGQWIFTQPVHRVEKAREFVLKVNKKIQLAGALFADVTDDGRLENLVMR